MNANLTQKIKKEDLVFVRRELDEVTFRDTEGREWAVLIPDAIEYSGKNVNGRMVVESRPIDCGKYGYETEPVSEMSWWDWWDEFGTDECLKQYLVDHQDEIPCHEF